MPDRPTILLQRLHPQRDADLPLPAYQSEGAAGCDLRAAVTEAVTLQPMQRLAIPTGLALAIPPGFEAQVRPRSGAALQHGLGIPNAPGTIDSDYRGELKVAVINLGTQPLTIERGDRIAQLVVAPVVQATFRVVEALDPTPRGDGGFGSTGSR